MRDRQSDGRTDGQTVRRTDIVRSFRTSNDEVCTGIIVIWFFDSILINIYILNFEIFNYIQHFIFLHPSSYLGSLYVIRNFWAQI